MASLAARADALRRVPLFADLSDRSLQRVARLATEVEIPKGQMLIEANAKGAGLYVIQEGTVSVQGRRGKRLELGAGEVVGELALLRADAARTARVQATTPVRAFSLSRGDFQGLLTDEPKLALALLATLAERLGNS